MLTLFGLIGQVAWVVENMYFNVFIYKMFRASAADISLMVAASAVTAAVTTLLIGALSDYVSRRKFFICGGYIIWGITILAFAFIRMDILEPIAGGYAAALSLGVTLVILMDCVMTFFGSSANDAAFNAWMTDWGDETDRGKIEGFNSMMPLVAILVVFGSFMFFDLDQAKSWVFIYLIIGGVVLVIGFLGIFLIKEEPSILAQRARFKDEGRPYGYWKSVIYSFTPSVIKSAPLLYFVVLAFAVFNISIQIFMPYLILYYEKGLGMSNYVLIMAPAIILAAVITAFYGKVFDLFGFAKSSVPAICMLLVGYVLLFFFRGTVLVFIGSLAMMAGYLTGMSVFGAMIRSLIPENKAGQFQGIRIIGQVLIPGIIGPAIGAAVLANAKTIMNDDGTTSFIPDKRIFAAAFIVAIILLIILFLIFGYMKRQKRKLTTKNNFSDDELPGLDQSLISHNQFTNSWNTEYPRPHMKREKFQILNMGWTIMDKPVKVPFPPESDEAWAVSSSFNEQADTNQAQVHKEKVPKLPPTYTYTNDFVIDPSLSGDLLLLHLGAVDQIAEVSFNGHALGKHEGGYLPFMFEITKDMLADNTQHLEVRVTDRLDRRYPYGKQRKKRGGMWYTPISGIWQTVWLESVPETYIQDVKVTATPVSDASSDDYSAFKVTTEAFLSNGSVQKDTFIVDNPRLWSPEDPNLYRKTILSGSDQVEIYYALRTIEIKTVNGIDRVCLNRKPVFLHGMLDQGYFPEGIYTPATPLEYARDILKAKELGFNMLRKHIKIEPEIFYYYCDCLGILVFQDMVNNGTYHFLKDTLLPTIGSDSVKEETYPDDKIRQASFSSDSDRCAVFIRHMLDTIRLLVNHPSVIGYTIFNEGWGQFSSDQLYELAKKADPSRLYDSTSGWFAKGQSDFDSRHIYFTKLKPPGKRPMFLSEFGGYSLECEGHTFSKYASYGYGACKSEEELTDRIIARYEELVLPNIEKGACGSVYTQLSDVEDEINGFYTYDRKVCKVDVSRLKDLAERIYQATRF